MYNTFDFNLEDVEMEGLSEYEFLSLQQANRDFYLNVILALVTFVSVLVVYLDYRNRKNKEKAEKSIEIAKNFALNIVDPVSILYSFFEQFGIDKIINKINFIKLEDFDSEELNSLYQKDDLASYKELMKENDPENNIKHIICDTLNNLEYMCMYISTNVADERCIYNSLHQQFLKVISLLYFEISFANTDNKDKYYTNIIHVYNLWKNKYIKITKKENKFKRDQKKKKKKLLLPVPKT